MALSAQVLQLDAQAEIERIGLGLRTALARSLHRRGAVVAVSGGIDSAVCAALAARALGPRRVLALALPERESAPQSISRARAVAAALGIELIEQDITPALEALGGYRARDEAMRRAVPHYGPGWRMKIVLESGGERGVNHFRAVARSPEGEEHEARLGYREYLDIVAATSFKQRVRKTLEYFHADRLRFAVLGTPNRLEYDQGFFVKNGDGSADVKPIAHLYKSQVYALAAGLHLPAEVVAAQPTTDTFSLPQSQDEFYFTLPYRQMDLALWAFNHDVSAGHLGAALGMTERQARLVYDDIRAKRRAAEYLTAQPILLTSRAQEASR